MIFAGSAPDPYTFREQVVFDDGISYFDKYVLADTTGKTQRTPRLNSGERTAVFIVGGQSNSCNRAPTPVTPTNASKIDNLLFANGGVYNGADPLLGCDFAGGNRGNIFTRMADKLITDDWCDRVILVPFGVGGASVANFATGVLNDRLVVCPRRCAAVGLPITAFLWQQGEQDQVMGTSQATYASRLATVINTPRNIGFDAPWLIAKGTYQGGVVSTGIQAAQWGAANGTDIFQGPNTDSLTGSTYRQVSGDVHFNDTGCSAAGNLWAAAVEAASIAPYTPA